MKKIIYVAIAIIFFSVGYYFVPKLVGGRSSIFTDTGGLLDVTKNETGTTTPSYFIAGTTASSSVEFNISGATNLALNWSLFASTTASVLQYEIFYSNDVLDSETDWYSERSVSSGVINAGTDFFTWTPVNATSTNYALIDVDGVRANKIKIEYNIIGANGAVTLEVAAQ